MAHGENHYNAKLTEAQVAEIRQRMAAGGSAVVLAAEYGVGVAHVYSIKRGIFWR